jgi:Spy/CpxP family protein refolding chaperone
MKLKMKTFIFFFFFILTVFMAASSFSQPSGMGMRKWRGEGPCWRASDLDLSQEQRKGLDLIQLTFFREAQLLRAQLFAKRLELRELLTNPTIRMESIRAKNSEIIELQSKQEEKTLEYLIKVRNLLTPEQLKNWCPEQEFPSFRERMHGVGPMGSTPPKRTLPPKE